MCYCLDEASLKCTVCQTPRSSLTIEDAASVSSAQIIECSQQSSSAASDDRWSCPACTYLNCLRTKKCVQCRTDRPAYCGSDPPVEDPGMHQARILSRRKRFRKREVFSDESDSAREGTEQVVLPRLYFHELAECRPVHNVFVSEAFRQSGSASDFHFY